LIADFLPAAADRRTHPRDDLLSFIASAPDLSLDQVVVTAILIAVAGHETTANLLGASLIRLLTLAPGGPELLIASTRKTPRDCRTAASRLPVQATGRTAANAHILDGIHIRCGDGVLVCVAAANPDPQVYDYPHNFRPGRCHPGR
jgi:cytochrome P450